MPEIGSSVEAVRAVRFYMSLKHTGNYIGVNCPAEVTSCSTYTSGVVCRNCGSKFSIRTYWFRVSSSGFRVNRWESAVLMNFNLSYNRNPEFKTPELGTLNSIPGTLNAEPEP